MDLWTPIYSAVALLEPLRSWRAALALDIFFSAFSCLSEEQLQQHPICRQNGEAAGNLDTQSRLFKHVTAVEDCAVLVGRGNLETQTQGFNMLFLLDMHHLHIHVLKH